MASDGIVQLQPDSTGKKVDTTELTVGGNLVERQRINIADPAAQEAFAGVQNTNPVGSEFGIITRPATTVPAPTSPARATTGRMLFVEDFSDGFSGMFNDGCGSAAIDWNIRFNGRPTVRLDPQNNSSTSGATGGNLQLTLGGSPQTITTSSNSTLVGTTAQSGTPTPRTTGWILLNGLSSGGPSSDTNSYVLSYTSAVVSGSTGAWTVTFSGVNVYNIPGTPSGASVTTANIGSAVMAVNNPNPNATGSPVTTGVVYKRRIDDQFSGRFGHEVWYRPTSKSAATSFTSVFTVSLYNRDGQNFWAARIMPQLAIGMNPGTWGNDNQLHWFLTGTSTGGFVWQPLGFATMTGYSQHSWDPVSGTWDKAGGWNYAKVIADFNLKQYVSVQINETVYTTGVAGTSLYQGVGDTGAKMMHFSVELAEAQSGTRRFWSVGKVTGTME